MKYMLYQQDQLHENRITNNLPLGKTKSDVSLGNQGSELTNLWYFCERTEHNKEEEKFPGTGLKLSPIPTIKDTFPLKLPTSV